MGKKSKQQKGGKGTKSVNVNSQGSKGTVNSQGVRGTVHVKAFKVKSQQATKAKHRAKAVTTNLKKLNVQNRQQVSQSDSTFTELQKTMKTTHKEKLTTANTSTAKVPAKSTTKPADAPNMDEASELMASL